MTRFATFPSVSPSRRAVIGGVLAATFAPRLAAAAQLSVVATTGMIADAARRVGGDRVAVSGLMGPGVDPHAYRQTRSDVALMSRADLILWHGLRLEAQLERLFADLAARKPVVAVAEALDPALLLADEEYPEQFDPHVWMDPALWSRVVDAVRDALTAADPGGADVFAANAAAYRVEVAALGAYAAEALASVPERSRVLVTAHDAFGYFGSAFDFEVQGVQGISTVAEAGLRRIEELVALLVDRRIPAVFVETSVSERNVRALIEGAEARGWSVRIGAELFSDAMGPEGTYEGTWIGMIDHNVTAIARALGGAAPERGMRGLLAGPV